MQWNLIRLRKEAGLTQDDLAEKIGISVSAYRNKERGIHQFAADEMFKIRAIFGVPVDDIFLPTNCTNNAI